MKIDLRYNICFCTSGNLVLMLYRRRSPNRSRWNGIGGKIEFGESPYTSIEREVAEETDLNLDEADDVRFGGIVSWPSHESPELRIGMYAFIARFDSSMPEWNGHRVTTEGDLAWLSLTWVCDASNSAVVENIPHFLPPMLYGGDPKLYACHYKREKLLSVVVQPIKAAGLITLPERPLTFQTGQTKG